MAPSADAPPKGWQYPNTETIVKKTVREMAMEIELAHGGKG